MIDNTNVNRLRAEECKKIYDIPFQEKARRYTLEKFAELGIKYPTGQETILWSHIKNGKLGKKFHQQYIIGNYIVDFFALGKNYNIIIEIDDTSKYYQEKEAKRDKFLQSEGLVLRFTNLEVECQIDMVLDYIREAIIKCDA